MFRRTARAPQYPEPRFRAAIVQMEAVHEECVPALVHLLRLHGVEPVVFLNRRIRENRPGFKVHFPDAGSRTTFVRLGEKGGRARLRRKVRQADADLLVLNTFQNAGPSRWASWWQGPMLGVVHNPQILRHTPESLDLVTSDRIGLLTLAPHVTANLMASNPERFATSATITSTFPVPPQVQPAPTSGRRRVAVSGSVNFRSRDYEQVLDAIPNLNKQVDPGSYEIAIVGGGADRRRLEDLVAERGHDDQFAFVPLNENGYVPSSAYYQHLLSADFLLPLVPPTAVPFRVYKITSAVPTSTGLGVPAILDRWSATVYGLPAVTYTGAAVSQGLERALAMTRKDLSALRGEVAAARERDLARAEAELGYALRARGLDV